jgi:hypothetical protein
MAFVMNKVLLKSMALIAIFHRTSAPIVVRDASGNGVVSTAISTARRP